MGSKMVRDTDMLIPATSATPSALLQSDSQVFAQTSNYLAYR